MIAAVTGTRSAMWGVVSFIHAQLVDLARLAKTLPCGGKGTACLVVLRVHALKAGELPGSRRSWRTQWREGTRGRICCGPPGGRPSRRSQSRLFCTWRQRSWESFRSSEHWQRAIPYFGNGKRELTANSRLCPGTSEFLPRSERPHAMSTDNTQ